MDKQGRFNFEERTIDRVAKRLAIPVKCLEILLAKSSEPWDTKYIYKLPCVSHRCMRGGEDRFPEPAIHRKSCARVLHIPMDLLVDVHKAISARILWPMIEKRKLDVHHGFIRERSVRTNAQVHIDRGHDYFLRIDLEDAFGQINHRRIEAMFRFGLPCDKEESHLLTRLVTPRGSRRGGLPQGAVTSPLIYVLVMDHLLATKIIPNLPGEMLLTSYADDFILSSNEPIGPGRIRGVYRAFAKAGLRINEKKTLRFIRRGGAVRLPGVMIRPLGSDTPLGVRYEKIATLLENIEKWRVGKQKSRVVDGQIAWLAFIYGPKLQDVIDRKLLDAIRDYYARRSHRKRFKRATPETWEDYFLSLSEPKFDPGPEEPWDSLLLERP